MNGRRVLYATMPLLVVIVKRDGSSYLLPYDWGKKPPFTSFDHPGTIQVFDERQPTASRANHPTRGEHLCGKPKKYPSVIKHPQ